MVSPLGLWYPALILAQVYLLNRRELSTGRGSGREVRESVLWDFSFQLWVPGLRRLGLKSLTKFSCVTLGKSLPFPVSLIFITRKMRLPICSLVLARAVVEIQ